MVTAEKVEKVFEEEPLPDELLWAEKLSPVNFRRFIGEVYYWYRRTMEATKVTEADVKELDELFEAWEATAEIDADPELAARLRMPVADKKYLPLSA